MTYCYREVVAYDQNAIVSGRPKPDRIADGKIDQDKSDGSENQTAIMMSTLPWILKVAGGVC